MNTLTRVRQSTAARLRALPLPEAFANATITTAARATYSRRATSRGDARRSAAKAARVLATLAVFVTGCGGIAVDTREDPRDRFAYAVCMCHDKTGAPWSGCFENARGEVANVRDLTCLDEIAAAYELDCSGRSGPGCTP